jgi:winged helix DNA-binding protein
MLTERALNRALLARQLLLGRRELPVTRVIEQIGGLQTQYAPSAYVGLWSRLPRFEHRTLTGALERKQVIQATLMRATIHMVTRRDYWPIAAALREGRRDWWLRATRHTAGPPAMEAAAMRVRSLLADGPMKRPAIVERLGLDAATWNGIGLWVDLVRVPPSGTWDQRRADLFGLAEEWVGPSDATAEQGVRLLIRRYLAGFGPGSREDLASFTGLSRSVLEPGLDALRLRRFRDEHGRELLDVPRAPLPDPDTPAPVRFLPTWDATLLVHARRTQILPERFRPLVFNTKTPHSVPTFLVNGQVAGTWRSEKDRVAIEPFERLPRDIRRRLDDEAERLAAFHS